MKSQLWLALVLGCFLATRGVLCILGGPLASPGEFPYVVGIGRFSETGSPNICAGGIIDEKFVITAAHCVTDVVRKYNGTLVSKIPNTWVFVYANTTNFQKDLGKSMSEARSGLNRTTTSSYTRRVVKAYILSEFLTDGVADIAILELERPLNLNDGYLKKLKLPTGRKISYEGTNAVLAGFGEDVDELKDYGGDGNKHVNDGSLKKAHFRIMPDSKCIRVRSVRSKPQKNTFCMTAVTEDNKQPEYPLGACGGDSGGPIVLGKTVIAIMMSVSPKTCDGREDEEYIHPFFYTQESVNVRYYKHFINNVIGHRHLGNQSITAFKLKA